MKKSRLFKAVIIVLLCVAILWAVNLKTRCVPRATAAVLRQVVKVTPNSRYAYGLLGSTYHYLGRNDEGDKAYEQAEVLACQQAVEANPTDPNAHHSLGDAYFDQERYEDAVEAYRRTIQLDPNDFMAYYNLGIALDWLDRYEEEIEAFQEAIKLNPDDADAHFNLGDAYYQIGNLDGAIQALKETLSRDSSYRDAYEQLADCYWELDQPEKSFETWKRAIASDPDWAWPRVRLAFDYNDVGRYDEAIAEWKHLIELEPEIAGLHALLADVYLQTGQYAEAIAACETGLRIDAANAKSHFNLGRAHLEMGNKDSASEEYEVLKGLDEELANDLLELIRNHEDARKPPDQTPLVQDDSLDQDEAGQLRALDAELSSLDSYAAQERERIEKHYARNEDNVRTCAEDILSSIGGSDRPDVPETLTRYFNDTKLNMWIIISIVVIALLVWGFALRPSNFVVIARNVTHIYEYLKRTHGDAFDSPYKLLLAATAIDTLWYLKRHTFSISNLESIVDTLHTDNSDNHEIDTLEELIVSLECLIFDVESKFWAPQICFAVHSQRAAIRQAIDQARSASASGRTPTLWRIAADNFMVSPAFESLRKRIGVREQSERLFQT